MQYDEFNDSIGVGKYSHETHKRLDAYVFLLSKWNKSVNLIAKSTEQHIWQRHIMDCAQLVKFIDKNDKKLMDLGAGGGLPSVVIAILTGIQVTAIEADVKKCSFLNVINNEFNLNMKIVNKRIEDLTPCNIDVITSRAFAPLNKTFSFASGFIKKSKKSILIKGKNVVKEIEEAQLDWKFDYKLHETISENDGFLLEISNLYEK